MRVHSDTAFSFMRRDAVDSSSCERLGRVGDDPRVSDGLLDAAFPARSVRSRQWLRDPAGDLSGLLFIIRYQPRGDTRAARRLRGVPAQREDAAPR